MRRFTPGMACWLVAIDCGRRAIGAEGQSIFMPGLEWLWWFSAVIFGAAGISTWFFGSERR